MSKLALLTGSPDHSGIAGTSSYGDQLEILQHAVSFKHVLVPPMMSDCSRRSVEMHSSTAQYHIARPSSVSCQAKRMFMFSTALKYLELIAFSSLHCSRTV